MNSLISITSVLCVFFFSLHVNAAVFHDESLNGEIGTLASPTDVGPLGVGSHSFLGNVANSDQDIITFSVSAGLVFNQFILRRWEDNTDPALVVFLTESADNESYLVTSTGNIDTNLFTLLSLSPKGAGDYLVGTVTGFNTGSYEFEIVIGQELSAIPLPSSFPLFIGAIGLLGFLIRRNRPK